MLEHVIPIWRLAARTNARRLQVVQLKGLRVATNARSCDEANCGFGYSVFAITIKALTDVFN